MCLSLIPISGSLQHLSIHLRGQLPSIRVLKIILPKFLIPFPTYTSKISLIECFPEPCFFKLPTLWVEMLLSTEPVAQCLFRSSVRASSNPSLTVYALRFVVDKS